VGPESGRPAMETPLQADKTTSDNGKEHSPEYHAYFTFHVLLPFFQQTF
jgi:hypothetical protein